MQSKDTPFVVCVCLGQHLHKPVQLTTQGLLSYGAEQCQSSNLQVDGRPGIVVLGSHARRCHHQRVAQATMAIHCHYHHGWCAPEDNIVSKHVSYLHSCGWEGHGIRTPWLGLPEGRDAVCTPPLFSLRIFLANAPRSLSPSSYSRS